MKVLSYHPQCGSGKRVKNYVSFVKFTYFSTRLECGPKNMLLYQFIYENKLLTRKMLSRADYLKVLLLTHKNMRNIYWERIGVNLVVKSGGVKAKVNNAPIILRCMIMILRRLYFLAKKTERHHDIHDYLQLPLIKEWRLLGAENWACYWIAPGSKWRPHIAIMRKYE